MFKGKFEHSIDPKGRISIPAKLKRYISEAADNTLVMLPGANSCIEIYPRDIWSEKEKELHNLDENNPEHKLLIRRMLHETHEDKMDNQSRILIPGSLIKHAKIESAVLILGTLNWIEVWDPKEYENYLAVENEPLESLKARLLAKK